MKSFVLSSVESCISIPSRKIISNSLRTKVLLPLDHVFLSLWRSSVREIRFVRWACTHLERPFLVQVSEQFLLVKKLFRRKEKLLSRRRRRPRPRKNMVENNKKRKRMEKEQRRIRQNYWALLMQRSLSWRGEKYFSSIDLFKAEKNFINSLSLNNRWQSGVQEYVNIF